jgi:hypothetical protein
MLNVQQPQPNTKKKAGKIVLDPINQNYFNQSKMNFNPSNNSNKKMELSFKATFQFTDNIGNNNKIEINPNINLNHPTKMNVNMKQLPSHRVDNEYEEDEY